MKLKALITMLVLGSSSAAMARPAVIFDAHAQVTIGTPSPSRPIIIRDRRDDRHERHDRHDRDDRYDRDGRYSRGDRERGPRTWPTHDSAPVWNDGVLEPTNTTIGSDSSSYVGPIFNVHASVGHHGHHGYYTPSRFVTLTQPTRIDRGREFFTLGAEVGAFSKIALRPTAGRTFVQQVAIEFVGGGRTQVVPVNQHLDGTFVIELDGRGARTINRIVVYGSSGARSSYALMGA